jgi:thiol-disulfide isomerase/thioredoxin
MNSLQQQLAQANPDAQAAIRTEMQAKSNELTTYREGIMQQHPRHLLSGIFHVLKEPAIPPAEQHPGGKYDSLFAYQYYKSHYWDNISFTDERLIRTPVFQQRLERYFGEILPQHPDSLILAASETIDASRTNPEMFKYLLATLTDKYVNPQYMGQDAVFVHLFEKYFITGQADSWMNEKYKKFIFDRGYSLMANVIGKKAANFDFIDTLGRKSNLYAQNAPFTVLCFWDPTCGHCQEEVPRLDTLFQQKWRQQGVAMIGMMTDGGVDKWKDFIRTKKLKGWVHVYQTDAMKDADVKASRPTFRQLYDVYQTPMLYLLDKEKRIVAKRLSYSQIDELLQLKLKAAAAATTPKPAVKK